MTDDGSFSELIDRCKRLDATLEPEIVHYKGRRLALVVPEFGKKVLRDDVADFDADTFIKDDLGAYPIRRAGDRIVPGAVQWIDGSHPDLQYRGNNLRRHKMWFQLGSVKEKVLVYGYTGWQYGIAHATFDVLGCPALSAIMDSYNTNWSCGMYPSANHGIVTQYRDGNDYIGMHSDKPSNIADGSLISIVKLGPAARPFRIESLAGDLVYQKVLSPGTAVIMTKESNLECKHGVPISDDVGLSGSLVFRTITRTETAETVRKRSATTEARRAKRDRKES